MDADTCTDYGEDDRDADRNPYQSLDLWSVAELIYNGEQERTSKRVGLSPATVFTSFAIA